MGLIKKKTAIRGTEGGVKYVCDVCSVDITATVRNISPQKTWNLQSLGVQRSPAANDCSRPQVRIQCVECPDYDLCVPCFSEGKSSRDHNPATHRYRVIEQ